VLHLWLRGVSLLPNFPELPPQFGIKPVDKHYLIFEINWKGEPKYPIVKVMPSCFSGYWFQEVKGRQLSKENRALLEPWLEKLNA
jgi:hypothetical protein